MNQEDAAEQRDGDPDVGATTASWRGERTPHEDSCEVCGKPTRSHTLLEAMTRPDGLEVDLGWFAVCHTCYREHDGDAARVLEVIQDGGA